MEDILVSAFLKILNMSITGGYIILAVMLARLILRRAPKKYSYALWAVALFRLICPVSFKSVISIFALKPFAIRMEDSVLGSKGSEIVHIPENIGMMTQPEIQTGISAVDKAVNESLPGATPMYSANPLQIWEFVGMLLWLAGITALLVISLIGLWRLCRRLRTATLLEGNVWQSEKVQSPFIIGLFKPKIYIPYGLEGAALGYVLTHERAHIKRGDHIIRTLAYLVLCLHWFNPLVWLAFWLMGRDMELSCDEKVLGCMGGKAEYSETLLSFASPRRFPTPTPLAFGESGVARRIKNALKWKRPRLWVSVVALVLCAVVIAACAANPKVESEQSPVTDKIETDEFANHSLWKLLTELDVNNTSYFGITAVMTDYDVSMSDIHNSIIDALGDIRPDEIKVGRGIPRRYSIDIGYGSGEVITLGYGGSFVELQLSEGLKEKYPIERGVWEIHNAALTELMAGLEAKPFAEFELNDTDALKILFDIPGVDLVDYSWQTEAFPVGNSIYSSSYSGNLFGEGETLLWAPYVERSGGTYPAERGEISVKIWRDNDFVQGWLNFRCSQNGNTTHCKAYASGDVTARLDEATDQIIVTLAGEFRPGMYEYISRLEAKDIKVVGINPTELNETLPDDLNEAVAEAFGKVRASELSIGGGVIFEAELALKTPEGTLSLLYDGDKVMLDFDGELEKKYSGIVGRWMIDSPAIRTLFNSILSGTESDN